MTTPHDPFDDILSRPAHNDRLSQLAARSAERRREISDKSPSPTSPVKKRHAAKGSRTAALGLSIVSTIGVAAYLHQTAQSSSAAVLDLASSMDAPIVPPSTVAPSTVAPSSSPTTAKSAAPSTTTTVKPATSSALADGTWTGTSSPTRWGPVQVRITVSGGKITAVEVPASPANDNRSISINRAAVPRLVQSTLTAQSANVNSVTGATYTSAGYKISLQSAIDKSRTAS